MFINGNRDNKKINPEKAQKDAGTANIILEGILRQLGRVSQSSREVSWQKARENYREILTSLAPTYQAKKGSVAYQINDLNLDAFTGGDEHILISVDDTSDSSEEIPYTSRIYKITHSECFGCKVLFDPEDTELSGKHFHAQGNYDPWLYLKRWQLLNSISSYTTRFEAIIAPEQPNWPPRICISQPYIPGEPPSQTIITEAFMKFNFHPVSLGAYYSHERDILLTDAFPRNVRIWQGAPVPFDAIAINPNAEMKTWLHARI